MDVSANENGKVDFNFLSKSLDSTSKDTKLVFELVKSGGYALKIPLFTAFGIAIYALNKYTSKKKFHRKGEEHGSARWANAKEVKSLLDKPKKQKLPFKVKVHNFFEKLKFWKRKKKEYVVDIAVPLMFTGFFRYNDMAFEQFVYEVIRFHTSPQQRIYSYEPPFMELRNGYINEELTAEIEMMKSRKKRFFKRK